MEYLRTSKGSKTKKKDVKTNKGVTRVSLYHTVKTKCVAMLLIELQSPVVSVGNTIRTQIFHEESTCSKQINQLNIRRLNILRRRQ